MKMKVQQTTKRLRWNFCRRTRADVSDDWKHLLRSVCNGEARSPIFGLGAISRMPPLAYIWRTA